MSHVETASSAGGDQSDLEIRVNTLQEDLSRRMKTAARLKKEQKTSRRERLKVQEDALKKQIEVYDQLIVQTKVPFIYNVSTCIAQNLIWLPNFSQTLFFFSSKQNNFFFPYYILTRFHVEV